jgi:5-methyltetrahydropteroyltriglutamate--homocysteine methyltransferase
LISARSTIHGYPRIGGRRELKWATEAYWAGKAEAAELEAVAAGLRRSAWEELRDAGLDEIPSNTFSLYDHVLDTTAMVGAVPARFGHGGGPVGLDTYFAMARGRDGVAAMGMTKWFDTNYHYIVPELGPETTFACSGAKPLDELAEAAALGIATTPVLVGPVTYLLLGKPGDGAPSGFDPLSLLDPLLDAYAELLGRLHAAGAGWVRLDEPAFVQDRSAADLAALRRAYDRLGGLGRRPKLLVSTYFGHAAEALPVLAGAPVDGVGVDCTRGLDRTLEALERLGGLGDRRLVAGVVDGRNVWRNDLAGSLALLRRLQGLAGEVVVGTSCSLLHVPIDLGAERRLSPAVSRWLAFARQKVDEVVTLARGLGDGDGAIAVELAANRAALDERRLAAAAGDPAVLRRAAAVRPEDARRPGGYPERAAAQRARLGLPPLPTTTIGSFPQTGELREARAALRRGELDPGAYEARVRDEVERVLRIQEDLGLDVLVHGEPERNDMVQFFAERLDGFAVTDNGWVQSYGSRYVRPPILFGEVSRPRPITVELAAWTAGRTARPVKGMLTGPVTILKWSFVRDDQPSATTARQVALALRGEVADLEAAGIAIIQVDEPALREGMPLRRDGRDAYVAWAVEAFRLATAGVRDDTQIHTHMCYSEFGEILDVIAALDADVISIEAARSRMELVHDLERSGYPRGIGLGIYDIHAPQVPPVEEMVRLLRQALEVLPADRVWVNPDCGLKTRGYAEVVPSLRHLVAAAEQVRRSIATTPTAADRTR